MQFSPTPDEQLQYTTKGVAGDIVLEYDVMHTREGSYTEVTFSTTLNILRDQLRTHSLIVQLKTILYKLK